MNQCYCKVNNLQTDIYTDYFLNEFIPKNAVTANTTLTTINQNLNKIERNAFFKIIITEIK